jgi:hypothetical protein
MVGSLGLVVTGGFLFSLNKTQTSCPGYLERDDPELQLLCDKYTMLPVPGLVFCGSCGLVKPAGVHHCSTCRRCVHGLDHHCVYVDTCIGAGNRRIFIQTLGWAFVCCVAQISIAWAIASTSEKHEFLTITGLVLVGTTLGTLILFVAVSALLGFQLFLLYNNDTTITYLQKRSGFDKGMKALRHVQTRQGIKNLVQGLCG